MARASSLVPMAMGVPRFMAERLTAEHALEILRARMATREERFLASARTLIFADPRSPYARLLAWAGIQEADLERLVRSEGLGETLRKLRDAGVHVTMQQLKGLAPIDRNGLSIETDPAAFDSPVSHGLRSSSSGTRSAATAVSWDWALIEEHAANERLLHSMHRFDPLPLALWLPAPPGLAGIHSALLQTKARRPVDRWFSPVAPGEAGSKILGRRALELGFAYIRSWSRILGCRIPAPQTVRAADAAVVARWMAERRAEGSTPILRTYAGLAVRAVRAGLDAGMDLTGSIALTGGEPLTPSRRAFLQSAGVRAVSRYSSSEAGLIGASCPQAEHGDDIHLYEDRLAVIGKGDPAAARSTLLFTTLSLHTGKVLLNADIGDEARIEDIACICELGRLGMRTRLREVRSSAKLTAGGMAIPLATLESIVASEVMNAGGAPSDVQIVQSETGAGEAYVELVISPRVTLDEKRFLERVTNALTEGPQGGELAALIWRQERTLRVARREPQLTRGSKQPLVIRESSPAATWGVTPGAGTESA